MAPTWTTVKGYDFTKRALEAWLCWRFAGYEDAAVEVKVKDGDFTVYAPEKLTTKDKRRIRKDLKEKRSWDPPDETWEELNGGE